MLDNSEKKFGVWWDFSDSLWRAARYRYSKSYAEMIDPRYAVQGKVAIVFQGCASKRERTGDAVLMDSARY
jgi:hypothetical protein